MIYLPLSQILNLIWLGINRTCYKKCQVGMTDEYFVNYCMTIIKNEGTKAIYGEKSLKDYKKNNNIPFSGFCLYFFHNILKLEEDWYFKPSYILLNESNIVYES